MSSSTHPVPFLQIQRTYKKSDFPNTEQYSTALFTCTNHAGHLLVRCPRHLSHLPSSFSTTKKHYWSILLYCDVCDSFWSVCSQCQNVRARMTNKSQCNRHHAKYHMSNRNVAQNNNTVNPPNNVVNSVTLAAPSVATPPLCYCLPYPPRYQPPLPILYPMCPFSAEWKATTTLGSIKPAILALHPLCPWLISRTDLPPTKSPPSMFTTRSF